MTGLSGTMLYSKRRAPFYVADGFRARRVEILK